MTPRYFVDIDGNGDTTLWRHDPDVLAGEPHSILRLIDLPETARFLWPLIVEAVETFNLAEQGRRLASQREDLIASGVDPAELAIPLHPNSLGWWSISGSEFLRALRMVADGNDPEMVYAEFYANSDIERPGDDA